MKKLLCYTALVLLSLNSKAQVPGDTIVIKGFKYGSSSRDTMISFPPGNVTYEKIIMKYNMRCKNALVSNSTNTEQGCGQWDYSCNTYIVDSTKVEQALTTHPSHVISNFTGNTFNYTSQVPYDYYTYAQTTVSLSGITSESQYTVAAGTTAVPNVLKTNEPSGRSQILYTAAELSTAGFVAGNIDAILLNVANSGGVAHFLKLGIQHTSATALDGNAPTLSGFTSVYNNSYTFTAGSNRLQFYTPFVWNGTSNILIDLSYTNSNPSTPIVFNGTAAGSSPLALYARNNYALNLAAYGHVNLNATLMNAISNELSVAFWAFGNSSQLPASTNFMFGYDSNPNNRQFSLQLPWGDNNLYYDCGFSNNGYDRINKAMSAAEQGGQWNHWAFTKNAVSGTMNIYLNGALWATGTGKTRAITIMGLILGTDQNLDNNYKGKVNELSIWSKELSAATVAAWMNKPIDATHPQYSNLVAYYKMNEGTGLTITDSRNNLTSTGVNLQWTYDRGQTLSHMFTETTQRPGIVFLRGVYTVSTSTVVTTDSLAHAPNIVQQYTVVNNASLGPLVSDAVNVISTTNLYQSTPRNIYNGDTGALTGTLATSTQSTIAITTLNYYNRYPYYNEIMSFVTPYGIGLDLGAKGKTWYFDVTDLTPLLKGKKRMMMTLGGERQEQMDIDFWFIVGTPPRTVLEFNQLWQGAARAGGAPIATVNNDSRFPPIGVPTLSNGHDFKLRSTITGHGAQGEFQANGGQITHAFNVNGGPDEFNWTITNECSMNPVYPQGGTWLYARQGWCPGKTSVLNEFKLTPFITAGTTATLDYNCSAPPVATGDYRFIVANQLITYGSANHTLDAAIVDVMTPSNKILYLRSNPVCANPKIIVQNTGSTHLTSIDIDYWLNDATTHQTYTWNGDLDYMDTATVILPTSDLWLYGLQQSAGNRFNAKLIKANSVVDDYSFNNTYSSPFVMPDVLPNQFTIEFKTNTYYSQDTYTLIDDLGNTIGSSNFTAANTVYADNYILNGCYTFIVEDSGEDGLQWFANTAQGSGYVRIKSSTGTILKTFQADFGKRFEYSFTAGAPLSITENTLAHSINIYPNPSHNKFVAEGAALENAAISMTDLLGRNIEVPASKTKTTVEVNTGALTPGAYFLKITKDGNSAVKKIIVY